MNSFHCKKVNIFIFPFNQLCSFHLYELIRGRHMFDYERAAGQAFMKDGYNRLKSYDWTDTGIKLIIPGIKREIDLGNYEGDVDIGEDYKHKSIEVREILGKSLIHLKKC